MIKVCVIGVGSIGEHHARIFSELRDVNLVGVVDIDFNRAKRIASQYSSKAYGSYSKILNSVDAVTIAVPTKAHFKIAMDCLNHDKDILVEKPITSTVDEAETLVSEAVNRKRILQIGHLERFNAGVSLIGSMVDKPRFIESQRLSPFLSRGTDVDVTLDLMIHDIDIILSLVKSEISDLRATGAKILSDTIDIAYAWLEFDNGCIAEIIASRIATARKRQLKVFQRNSYLNLDYQTQKVLSYRNLNGRIRKQVKKPKENEPLWDQLASFAQCVKNRNQPVVSGIEGEKALRIALRISEMINNDNTAKKRDQ